MHPMWNKKIIDTNWLADRQFFPVIDTTNVLNTGQKYSFIQYQLPKKGPLIDTKSMEVSITRHFCPVIDTFLYQLTDMFVR